MTDDTRPFQHRPAEYKTSLNDRSGLVRVPLVGGAHEGRELYIDEMELPPEIWTSAGEPFEWWPERIRDAMATTAVGGDPANPPIHYVLEADAETREPRFIAQPV
jgi:hypothetical protein